MATPQWDDPTLFWDDGVTFWDGGIASPWIEQPEPSGLWIEQPEPEES